MYLSYKSFDTAYGTLAKALQATCNFDSFQKAHDLGLTYQVKKMTSNKKDQENAEVSAVVVATPQDGSAPKILEYRFTLKKEDNKWRIYSYLFDKQKE
ncbi:MAG: hypothetical protein RDV48_23295 [Candidatus Eremiobacteraeota bacterium]|nr:hypothetical protein [Candidatus Eremiobacteraeota bacterium]